MKLRDRLVIDQVRPGGGRTAKCRIDEALGGHFQFSKGFGRSILDFLVQSAEGWRDSLDELLKWIHPADADQMDSLTHLGYKCDVIGPYGVDMMQRNGSLDLPQLFCTKTAK